MRHAATLAAVAVLLSLSIGCGGSDDGSTPGDGAGQGGDPNLVSRWEFEWGIHRILWIEIDADGTYVGELWGSCTVTGSWSASGGFLTLRVGTTSPTCISHDISPGDAATYGYELMGDRIVIADEDGTSTLVRA